MSQIVPFEFTEVEYINGERVERTVVFDQRRTSASRYNH